MGRLGREGVLYLIGTILQRGLAFLLVPIATRVLGVTDFGVYSAAAAVGSVLAMFFGLGLNFAIVRLFYDEKRGMDRTAWAFLVRVQILAAVALAGLTWLTGPVWAGAFRQLGWGGPLQAAVGFGLANALQNASQGVLRAQRRPVAYVAVSLIQTGVGGVLGLVLASEFEAAGYLIGLGLGSLAAGTVSYWLTRAPVRVDWPALRVGLALGLPFLLHWLSTWALNLSDRFLLERYTTLAQLGRYQLAYALGTVGFLLLESAQAAWGPHFFSMDDSEEKRSLPGLALLPALLTMLSVTVLLVAASPVLVDIAAPPEFGEPAITIALVASATFVRAPYFVAVVGLMDAKRSGTIATASLTAAIVNIALNLVLIPSHGIIGAASSTLVAYAVQAGMVLSRAQSLLGVRLVRLEVLAAVVAGTGLVLGTAALPTSPGGIALRCASVGTTAAIAALALARTRDRYRRIVGSTRPSPSSPS